MNIVEKHERPSCHNKFLCHVQVVLELLLYFMAQHAVVHSHSRHAAFECPWNSESVITLCSAAYLLVLRFTKNSRKIIKKKYKIPVIGPALDASLLKTLRGFLIYSLSLALVRAACLCSVDALLCVQVVQHFLITLLCLCTHV